MLTGKPVVMKMHTISGNVPKIVVLGSNYNWIATFTGEKIVLTKNVKFITANITANTVYDCKFYLSIEAYDTDELYSPSIYQQQAFTLPAEHPYLAKLPDGTADEIIVDKDGNVSLVARVQKIAFTSKMATYQASTGSSAAYLSVSILVVDTKKESLMSSNYETSVHTTASGKVYLPSNTTVVYRDSRFTSKENALELLKNETTYLTQTPVTYSLGKISIPALPESVSNAWTDAEITPTTSIEYIRDVNIVVGNLEKAIASITEG